MMQKLKILMSQDLYMNAINVEIFSCMTPEKRFSCYRNYVKQGSFNLIPEVIIQEFYEYRGIR